MTDREAYIVLNMISGVGPIRLSRLCEKFGSPVAVLNAQKKDIASIEGIGEPLAEKIFSWRNDVNPDKELRLTEKAGVKILTKADSTYPKRLIELPDSPLCLYVRGSLEAFNKNSIAIVGSRRITNYGKRMTEYLASSAAYASWVVISGLAFGTDAVAHEATINASGLTVAVLGGGLARIFPQENISLARKIVDSGGALISEFPMEFSPNKRSFPMRNRIISGLSLGTIVIEAGIGSGALITAKFALEQGRSVFAVPGEADNPQARGCNKLIKDGAKLVENFDDVLEEFEFLTGIIRDSDRKRGDDENQIKIDESTLSEDELKIFEILKIEDKNIENIAIESKILPGKLLATLMNMEMKKIVVQYPGKVFGLNRKLKK
ncbi:MAG TPA: DNA-processing protein DprA [Victivallales bacterium]|nr:DNA-processing protein DprA [Victivallales bacterium]